MPVTASAKQEQESPADNLPPQVQADAFNFRTITNTLGLTSVLDNRKTGTLQIVCDKIHLARNV